MNKLVCGMLLSVFLLSTLASAVSTEDNAGVWTRFTNRGLISSTHERYTKTNWAILPKMSVPVVLGLPSVTLNFCGKETIAIDGQNSCYAVGKEYCVDHCNKLVYQKCLNKVNARCQFAKYSYV